MNCLFVKQSDNKWSCSRCNYVSKRAYENAPEKRCNPGLGDKLQKKLSQIGVTKKRVNTVLKFLGFKKCGCKKRQRILNDIGAKLGL